MSEISKDQALSIFWDDEPKKTEIEVTDKKPNWCAIYGSDNFGDCWYLFPKSDIQHIGSVRVVCISKTTGKILFDGYCGD